MSKYIYVVSATNPRTTDYHGELSTDDWNVPNSEISRLAKRGYKNILVQEVEKDEHGINTATGRTWRGEI